MKFVSLFLMSLLISFKSFCANDELVAAAMQKDLIVKFDTLCDAKIAELEGKIASASSVSGGGVNPYHPESDEAVMWDANQQTRVSRQGRDFAKNTQALTAWRAFKAALRDVLTTEFIQELNSLLSSVDKSRSIQGVVKTRFKLEISFSDVNKIMAQLPVHVLKIKQKIEGMGAEAFREIQNLYQNGTGKGALNRPDEVGLGEGEFGRRREVFDRRRSLSGSDEDDVSARAPARLTVDPRFSSSMAASGFGGRLPVSDDDPDPDEFRGVEAVDDVKEDYCPSSPTEMAYGSRFGYTQPPPVQHGMRYGGVGMTSVGGYSSVYGRGEPVSALPPKPYGSSFGPNSGYGAAGVYGASAGLVPPALLTNGDVDEDEELRRVMEASVLDVRQRADSDEAPTGPVYKGPLTDPEFQGLSMRIRQGVGIVEDDLNGAAAYFDQQVIENALENYATKQEFIDSVNSLLTEAGFNPNSFNATVADFLRRHSRK